MLADVHGGCVACPLSLVELCYQLTACPGVAYCLRMLWCPMLMPKGVEGVLSGGMDEVSSGGARGWLKKH